MSLETDASLPLNLQQKDWFTDPMQFRAATSENVPLDMCAKFQITLLIRAVWYKSSQGVVWKLRMQTFFVRTTKSGQDAWIRMLQGTFPRRMRQGTFPYIADHSISYIFVSQLEKRYPLTSVRAAKNYTSLCIQRNLSRMSSQQYILQTDSMILWAGKRRPLIKLCDCLASIVEGPFVLTWNTIRLPRNTLTLVLLNLDIPWICKQSRSRSVGVWRSQLIQICAVCHSVSELMQTIWIK